mmetsp:Transcript_65406/g.108709  ORF Transcript_65406/g.108709 Transcript_65406/m.108709 type:complete len:226 (-) Transcript_65406:342-1019(-)
MLPQIVRPNSDGERSATRRERRMCRICGTRAPESSSEEPQPRNAPMEGWSFCRQNPATLPTQITAATTWGHCFKSSDGALAFFWPSKHHHCSSMTRLVSRKYHANATCDSCASMRLRPITIPKSPVTRSAANCGLMSLALWVLKVLRSWGTEQTKQSPPARMPSTVLRAWGLSQKPVRLVPANRPGTAPRAPGKFFNGVLTASMWGFAMACASGAGRSSVRPCGH